MSELRALASDIVLAVAASLFMVHAMVKWTAAMLERGRRPEEPVRPGLSATVRWGWLYLLAWAAIVVGFVRLLVRLGEDRDLVLAMLVAAAAGWLGLNWGFLALARRMRPSDPAGLVEPYPDEDESEEEEPPAG